MLVMRIGATHRVRPGVRTASRTTLDDPQCGHLSLVASLLLRGVASIMALLLAFVLAAFPPPLRAARTGASGRAGTRSVRAAGVGRTHEISCGIVCTRRHRQSVWATVAVVTHWGEMGWPIPRSVGLSQPVRHLRPGANFGHAGCWRGRTEPVLSGLSADHRARYRRRAAEIGSGISRASSSQRRGLTPEGEELVQQVVAREVVGQWRGWQRRRWRRRGWWWRRRRLGECVRVCMRRVHASGGLWSR